MSGWVCGCVGVCGGIVAVININYDKQKGHKYFTGFAIARSGAWGGGGN